jgi:hypothetical protein
MANSEAAGFRFKRLNTDRVENTFLLLYLLVAVEICLFVKLLLSNSFLIISYLGVVAYHRL